jgi:hypothetical protein
MPAAHHPRLHPGHHLRRLRARRLIRDQQSECATASIYCTFLPASIALLFTYSLLYLLACSVHPSVFLCHGRDDWEETGMNSNLHYF